MLSKGGNKYTDNSKSVVPAAPNPEGLKNCSLDDGEAEVYYFSSWSINGSLK